MEIENNEVDNAIPMLQIELITNDYLEMDIRLRTSDKFVDVKLTWDEEKLTIKMLHDTTELHHGLYDIFALHIALEKIRKVFESGDYELYADVFYDEDGDSRDLFAFAF